MIMTRNRTFAPPRLRSVLCSVLFIAASIAVVGAIGSSRSVAQGGSASPEDDSKIIARVANIRQQSRLVLQRVQENAFHLKIAPWVIERTANGEKAEFFVVLADQADLSGAASLATKAEKGRYVYDALRNKSQATQQPMLQWLRERGIEHRSFYIVNAVLVKGSREVVEALASRQDVARIEGNPHIQNSLPEPAAFVGGSSQPRKPETVEPNITYTHAPDVWALGVQRPGNYSCRRGYWLALDTQRAKASVPRLGWQFVEGAS